MDEHTSSDIGKIKVFAIMLTEKMPRTTIVIIQQGLEVKKKFFFFSGKTLDPELSGLILGGKITYRNTDDLSKLGPNAGSFIKG
jgi:hypothetical protein